jgi:hypothetical protein
LQILTAATAMDGKDPNEHYKFMFNKFGSMRTERKLTDVVKIPCHRLRREC